jgi:hypothetical protein
LAAIADAQAVDFSAMAAAQRSCPELAEMMNSTTLQITTQVVGDDSLLGDVLTVMFRPLVPIQQREAVFQSLHSIHHPGVQATRCLIATCFCWLQMAKAITLTAGRRELAAAGVLLQEAVGGGHQILHLHQGAAGRLQRRQALLIPTGRMTVSPAH